MAIKCMVLIHCTTQVKGVPLLIEPSKFRAVNYLQ